MAGFRDGILGKVNELREQEAQDKAEQAAKEATQRQQDLEKQEAFKASKAEARQLTHEIVQLLKDYDVPSIEDFDDNGEPTGTRFWAMYNSVSEGGGYDEYDTSPTQMWWYGITEDERHIKSEEYFHRHGTTGTKYQDITERVDMRYLESDGYSGSVAELIKETQDGASDPKNHHINTQVANMFKRSQEHAKDQAWLRSLSKKDRKNELYRRSYETAQPKLDEKAQGLVDRLTELGIDPKIITWCDGVGMVGSIPEADVLGAKCWRVLLPKDRWMSLSGGGSYQECSFLIVLTHEGKATIDPDFITVREVSEEGSYSKVALVSRVTERTDKEEFLAKYKSEGMYGRFKEWAERAVKEQKARKLQTKTQSE